MCFYLPILPVHSTLIHKIPWPGFPTEFQSPAFNPDYLSGSFIQVGSRVGPKIVPSTAHQVKPHHSLHFPAPAPSV